MSIAGAEIRGDLTLLSPARLHQTNSLCLKLHAEPALRLAHEMLLFSSEKLSTFLGQVHYMERHQIECFFNKLKRFRRIALRCEKTISAFMGFVHLACAMIWLR